MEVVFGLCVDHAKHGIGVGLAINMRDAPVIADNLDVSRLCSPACLVGSPALRMAGHKQSRNYDQQQTEALLHPFVAPLGVSVNEG